MAIFVHVLILLTTTLFWKVFLSSCLVSAAYQEMPDINEHTPIFTHTTYTSRIPENSDPHVFVFKATATDEDIGSNGKLYYFLDGSSYFSIHLEIGEVWANKTFDREERAQYTVRLRAVDNGTPPRTGLAYLDVTIDDVNDNYPEFVYNSFARIGSVNAIGMDRIRYEGHVPENAFLGKKVLHIAAKDNDYGLNAKIMYTFEGGYDGGGDFNINAFSGTITVARHLDREMRDLYNLVALAVDHGAPQRATPVSVTVRVTDVNDNAPIFPTNPILLFLTLPWQWDPSKETTAKIVGTIYAHDSDEGANAKVTYRIISGPDADKFHLRQTTGKPGAMVITRSRLFSEQIKNEYMFNVEAASGVLKTTATAKVRVDSLGLFPNSDQLDDYAAPALPLDDHTCMSDMNACTERRQTTCEQVRCAEQVAKRCISGSAIWEHVQTVVMNLQDACRGLERICFREINICARTMLDACAQKRCMMGALDRCPRDSPTWSLVEAAMEDVQSLCPG